jgi:hypothetical protein
LRELTAPTMPHMGECLLAFRGSDSRRKDMQSDCKFRSYHVICAQCTHDEQ